MIEWIAVRSGVSNERLCGLVVTSVRDLALATFLIGLLSLTRPFSQRFHGTSMGPNYSNGCTLGVDFKAPIVTFTAIGQRQSLLSLRQVRQKMV